LGVIPDDNLYVTKVQASSCAFNILYAGDQIITINSIKVSTPAELRGEIEKHEGGVIEVGIIRPTAPQQQLPTEREQNILRRSGFEYMLKDIVFKMDKRLGLHIKEVQNRVSTERKKFPLTYSPLVDFGITSGS
jgi:membrane-associated protease RseP (regulator of RpoE activity)